MKDKKEKPSYHNKPLSEWTLEDFHNAHDDGVIKHAGEK